MKQPGQADAPGAGRARAGWLALALAVFAADQVTKLWVVDTLRDRPPVTVIARCFHLVFVQNTGGAFGTFRGMDPEFRLALFTAVPAVILVGLLLYSVLSPARAWLLQTGLALILGGALGNFADRVRLGYVVDFILWHWDDLHWPAFNIADSFITAGISLLILQVVLEEKRDRGVPQRVPGVAPRNAE